MQACPTLCWQPEASRRHPVGPQSKTRDHCCISFPRTRSQRKAGGGSAQPCDSIVVAYYFCGEPIPYRTLVRGRAVTLGQFKELLTKKGSYRYYFKKVSDEFDCGVVFEEVREDEAVLPVFEEKIIGKVEKVD